MIRKILSKKLIVTTFIKIDTFSFTVQPILKNNIRYAGHSHWQNVKNIKDAKDKIKQANSNLIANSVINAVKDGNGIRDPKINSYLAAVIERAKMLSIPMSTIDRILSRTDFVDPYVIEFQAPGGIFILAESSGKHPIKEKNFVLAIVKKYGFKPVAVSIVDKIFKQKAEIICKADDCYLINEDKALEVALEVGFEEVRKDVNENNEIVYKFYCHPHNRCNAESALVAKSIVIDSSEVYYEADNKIAINDETKALISEMINKICTNVDSVERIFINTD